MNAIVRITISLEGNPIRTYTFDESKECTVGRSLECDIVLPVTANREVSRFHCVLHIDPPVIWLRDLGSKNGTYVNNLRVQSSPEDQFIELRSGDELNIGPYTLDVFVMEREPTEEVWAAHAVAEWAV